MSASRSPRPGSAPARAVSPRARTRGANRRRTARRNQPTPDALARGPRLPTRFMPSFQSPLPMRGRPCGPAVRPRSMARRQCSKSEACSADTVGCSYDLVLRPGARAAPSRKGDLLVEDGGARRSRRGSGRRRRAARASRRSSASACRGRGRVPPVLDVALAELARRGAQEVLAEEVGTDDAEGHDVLELIAEAEGARRAGSSPERAQTPAARAPGRAASGSSSTSNESSGVRTCTAPRRCRPTEPRTSSRRRRRRLGRSADDRSRAPRAPRSLPWPSRNTTVSPLPGRDVHDRMERGAGVEARAEAALERRAGGGPRGRHSEPLRPRNSTRSPVAERSAALRGARRRRGAANSRL